MRALSRFAGLALATAVFFSAGVSSATTNAQKCIKARRDAAAAHAACQYKARAKHLAKLIAGDDSDYGGAVEKCRNKYWAKWPKFQIAFPGTDCDAPRFSNTGTTTIDNLTGLEWEQKTGVSGIHNYANTYTWSTSADGDTTDADGTVYLTFLYDLNIGGCLNGKCDWRLPTTNELQTWVGSYGAYVLNKYYPTSITQFIDPTKMVTVAGDTGLITYPSCCTKTTARHALAVRGGL